MSTPQEFDPLQPPPVQPSTGEPQEVDFGQMAPPPREQEQARPTTVYMPQAAALPAPAPRASSPVAVLLGLLATVILALGGLFPIVPPGVLKEGSVQGTVLFSQWGPDYEMRFDVKNWFMWAAMVMALVNLWLVAIRSWAGYWIISLGTLFTIGILYVMYLLPKKVMPGTGMLALALGGVILLFGAILGTRVALAAKRARYQY